MSKVLTNNAWLAGVVGLAFVLSFAFGFVTTQAEEDLEAQIAELMQTIAQLEAELDEEPEAPADPAPVAGGLTPVTFEGNMGPGSSGENVRALQEWLNENGYTVADSGAGSPGNETTYYGTLTQEAVGAFQDDQGVAYGQHRGWWGPASRDAARAAEGEPVDPVDPVDPANDEDEVDEDELSASLSADPETVDRGDSTTLSWDSQNATYCEGTGFDTEGETSGEVEVTVDEDTEYLIECEDEDGNFVEASVTVETEEPAMAGEEGYIELNDMSLSSVDIDLGDTEVLAEVEAEAIDSDVEVRRVDFQFNHRPWLFYDEVRLLMDGEEVASLSGQGDFRSTSDIDGSWDNGWRARFSRMNEVIRMDEEVTMELEVDVKSAIRSERYEGVDLQVDMYSEGLRYVDALGIMESYGALDNPVEINLEDDFGVGELSVDLNDDSPADGMIEVDEDDNTVGEEVLVFDVEAEDSDVEVQTVDLTIDYDSATTSELDDVLRRVRLYADGSQVGSKSSFGDAATTTVTIDDIDHMIARDDVETFSVEVEFYPTSNSEFHVPGELDVYVSNITGEDADYVTVDTDDLDVGEGDTMTVATEGLVASYAGKSADRERYSDDGWEGVYTFDIDVQAVNEDFYISESSGEVFNGTSSITLSPDADAEITHVSIDSTADLTDDTMMGGAYAYEIEDGDTETMTVTVRVRRTSGEGDHRVTLDEMEYHDEDEEGTSTSLGSPEFRSSSLFLRYDN